MNLITTEVTEYVERMHSRTEVNLRLARSLGLDTENLASFVLDVSADRLPVIRATYFRPDGIDEEESRYLLKKFTLVPHEH